MSDIHNAVVTAQNAQTLIHRSIHAAPTPVQSEPTQP